MDDTPSHADAIVVLGGGVLPSGDWSRTTTRAGMGLLTLTARCLHEYIALWMYRQRHWLA